MPVPTLYGMRLKTISVRAGGQVLRSYSLGYEISSTSGRSRLIHLTQLGNDGVTALPPMTFTWQGAAQGTPADFLASPRTMITWKPGTDYDSSLDAWNARFPVMTGDINGDGRADLVVAFRGVGGWFIQTALGQPNGTFQATQTLTDPNNAFDYNAYLKVRADRQKNGDSADWCEDVPLLGDVNADGFDDLVFVYIGTSGISTAVAYGSATGFTALKQSPYLIDGKALNTTGFCWNNAIERPRWQALLSDINRDSTLDLVLVHPNPAKPVAIQALGSPTGLSPFQLPGGVPITQLNVGDLKPLGTSGNLQLNQRLVSGDVDGDGVNDVVYINAGPQSAILYWLGEHSTGLYAPGQLSGDSIAQCQPKGWDCIRIFAGDFNGDGRLDVSAGDTVLFGDPSPGANLKPWARPHKLVWDQPPTSYPFQGADWNGDSISDSNYELGWLDGFVHGPPGPQQFHGAGCSRAANLNGDDSSDCFLFGHSSDATSLSLYWGTPTGISPASVLDLSSSINGWATTSATGYTFGDALAADVDNDGRADIVLDLGSSDHEGRTFRVGLMTGDLPDLMNRVDNGLGGSLRVTYTPASRIFEAIQPSYNTAGGWRANNASRPLVTTVERSNSMNLVETVNYKYENGGFTPTLFGVDNDDGFASIEITNANTLARTVTTYTWAGGEPRHVQDVVQYFGSGLLRRHETFHYSFKPPSGFQGVPGPLEIDVLDYEQGVAYRKTQRSYQYDAFGNEMKMRECIGDPTGTKPICVTTSTTRTDDQTSWFLGRIDGVKRQVDNGIILDWERRFYGPQEFLLQRRERLLCDEAQTCVCAPGEGCSGVVDGQPSPSRWVPVEQDRRHDPAGNLLFHRDALGHGTLFGYDYTQGAVEPTLIQRSVTSDGQTVTLSNTKTFNLVGGLVTDTDENGNVTSSYYDPLWRQIRRDLPDGASEWTLYPDFGRLSASDPDHAQRVIVVSAAGSRGTPSAANLFGVWKQQLFDGWGVVYKSRTAGDDGKVVEEEHDEHYANASKVVQYSKPHFVGPPSEWVLVWYSDGRLDRANRLIAGTTTVLRTFDYYTDHVAISDELGGQTLSYRDFRGRIVKVTDALGGMTSYGIDDAGRIRQASLPNGDSYGAHYDNWGRKRSGAETWSATTSFSYDDVSNLLGQTDAVGRTWSMMFDEINRLISRTTSEGTTTFHYDNCVGGRGRFCSVGAPDYSEKRTWDTRGRLASREIVDGATSQRMEVGYIYNVNGQLRQKTLPDGVAVSYDYTDAGYLSTVRIGSRQLATFGDYTALGKAGFRSDASGVITMYGYNDDGLIEESSTLDANDRKVLSYRYKYDPAGDVLSIADQRGFYPNLPPSLAPKPDLDESQTFTYDLLGRLTSATGPYGPRSYSYDASGIPLTFGAITLVRKGTTLTKYGTKTISFRNPETGQLFKKTIQVKELELTHDAAGFAAQRWAARDGASTFVWNNLGQLVRVARQGAVEAEMHYDADGHRFKKVEYMGSTPIVTLALDDFELRIAGTASAATDHISAPGAGLICGITSGQLVGPPTTSLAGGISQGLTGSTVLGLPAGEQYYYANHIGSIALVTDGSGNPIARLRYEPYGSIAAPSRGYRTTDHTFTGRTLDESTGLLDYGARMYTPEFGRFLSPDDRLSGGAYDPRAFNRYAYAADNPVKYVDPTGHDHVWYNQPWFKERFPDVALVMPYLHDAESATRDVTPTQWGLGGAYLASVVLSGGVTSIAGGGAVAGGVTGAVTPGVVSGFLGLGLVGDKLINVSEKGLAIVEAHLAKFGAVEENGAMVERLRAALQSGQKITGGDAAFYLHEIAEATQMAKLMQSGLGFQAAQQLAHVEALNQFQVSEFAVYPLEVIMQFRSEFGSAWIKFWEQVDGK